jgi:hypothetical protein
MVKVEKGNDPDAVYPACPLLCCLRMFSPGVLPQLSEAVQYHI